MRNIVATFVIAGFVAASATTAFAGGEFGNWRAPDANSVTSPAGDSSTYNPSVNDHTTTEGAQLSMRGGDNAVNNMAEITSSGQASPQGDPQSGGKGGRD